MKVHRSYSYSQGKTETSIIKQLRFYIYMDPSGHSFLPTEEEWNEFCYDAQSYLLGIDSGTGGALVKLGRGIRKILGMEYITDEEIARRYKEDETFRENYQLGEFMAVLGAVTTMSGGMKNSSQPSLVTTPFK